MRKETEYKWRCNGGGFNGGKGSGDGWPKPVGGETGKSNTMKEPTSDGGPVIIRNWWPK